MSLWGKRELPKEAQCRKDMTFGQRVADFWFYHKWHTLFVLFCVAAVAVCVTQCAQNEAADITVGLYLNETVTADRTDLLRESVKSYCKDHNEDGKTVADIYDFSYGKSDIYSANAESMRSKLMAELSSGTTILYITDATRAKELREQGILKEEAATQGTAFVLNPKSKLASQWEAARLGQVSEIIVFLRETDGFTIEKNKKFPLSVQAAKQVFAQLKALNETPAEA